ncbi:membrane integrity-associated transporter subunit PqiA [Acerihabitans sp. KWT182]|uniref:Membrane integrity-associated transporter subunit PqiA n=1 Tax=Acerihabitans sp. KWT182 TaxID=3157919 RepID=A0AAU7QEM1_9GAMM
MCSVVHKTRYVLCPHCDLLVTLPDLRDGQKGVCPRCKSTLMSRWENPRLQPVVFAISALIMLALANLFPFVNMKVSGLGNQISLPVIPQIMVVDHFSFLAFLFLLFVQAIPALCMASIIVLCLQVRMSFRARALLAKILFAMRAWGMAEILAGVLVSFVKLMAYGDIGVGLSFLPFCLFCALQQRAFQCIDRRWLWDNIMPMAPRVSDFNVGASGLSQNIRACPCCTLIVPARQPICPRCHTRGHPRRRHSLQWTMALLITSLLLYVPANILPIMITEGLGNRLNSTIIAGVILLWDDGSYPVALVIFIASIMVPVLKMIALFWLCWDAKGKGKADSERMHTVYDMVEFVGRWSMIDVFVIAVLSGLVRMGQLMSIRPGIGVVLFAMVVILTMVAAHTFDPRLLWDRVEKNMQKESTVD